MIFSLQFFLFEISIMQSQKFRSLIIWFQEIKPFKLIQEKRSYYKYTCDTKLGNCQELKTALEICSFLMVSLLFFSAFVMFSVCSLLTVFSFYLFCFFKTSLCPRFCLLRHWHNFMASFYHWVTLHCGSISQYFQVQTF